jgi:hypothetical protein
MGRPAVPPCDFTIRSDRDAIFGIDRERAERAALHLIAESDRLDRAPRDPPDSFIA